MRSHRTPRTTAAAMAGTGARMLRGLLSARQMVNDTFDAVEKVFVRGRASSDPDADEDGEFDGDVMENCQPIGLVARPAENATVAVVVGNVGGDGTNPYILGTVDGTRALIIDARGIKTDELDFAILYTSDCVVELRGGKIRIGSVGGSTQELATKADYDALKGYLDGHFHLHSDTGVPLFTSTPVKGTPATPVPDPAPAGVFTTKLEAE